MFWQALFAPWAGLRLLLSDRQLWRLALWPVVLTLIGLLVGVSWGLNWVYHSVQEWMLPWWPSGAWGAAARGLLGILLLLLSPGLFGLLFLPVAGLISIPFMEPLALATETKLQFEPPLQSTQWHPLRDMMGLLCLKVVVLGCALPLLAIPVVGWGIFAWLLALLTAVDCWDVALACRRYNLSEKLAFFRHYWPALLGFSLPMLLLIWVPVIQLLLLPVATVGAVQVCYLLKNPGLVKPTPDGEHPLPPAAPDPLAASQLPLHGGTRDDGSAPEESVQNL